METQTRNAIIGAGVGAGVGAAAGVGAGLAANKLIKPKSDAQFVSVAQANKIRTQIRKDVFGVEPAKVKVSFADRIKNMFKADNGKFHKLEKAGIACQKGLNEADKVAFAQRWNLDAKKGKETAENLLKQLGEKVKTASKTFTESLAKCRRNNLIAVGAVVVGTIAAIAGGIIGNAVSKKD